MKKDHTPDGRSSVSTAKIISLVFGGIILASLFMLLIFSEPLLNRYIAPVILKAAAEAYPAYSLHFTEIKYSVLQNRFQFDSVSIRASDGTLSGTINSFSIREIEWLRWLWGENITLNDFSASVVEMNDIVLKFPKSGYEFYCEQLHLSVPDSEMRAEIIEIHPLEGEEEFFRESIFQRTRFRFGARQSTVLDLAVLKILEGDMVRARFVQIHDPFLDILVNNDKPVNKKSPSPLMPNEILSSIDGILQIDSLSITNAQVLYGERLAVGSRPAIIRFDSMEVLAEGISNRGETDAVIDIHAEGKFQKSGAMSVHLSIPVASPEFSFKYSGSVHALDLRELNSFLEIAEQMRVKSGFLQTASFEVNVLSGQASGTVRAIYKDLKFVAINKQTGSEHGLFNTITSFIANSFTIRSSNVPDKSGAMKVGTIQYSRKQDDPFFRFSWFSIRSGVKDVVGF